MERIESKKKLGFGMMRLPKLPEGETNDFANVDIGQTKEMVDRFLEKGFTYFDTAWMYLDYKSEEVVKEVLTSRYPHDRYTLATKYHLAYKKKGTPEEVINGQLKRCGVDYFDYYLLHDVGHDNYKKFEECGAFDTLVRMKQEGKLRHIGFSCHDLPDFLEKILTEHPEMEFVQIQLNYLDWDSAGIQAHQSYDMITKFNRPVVVMEPVKGGTLANVPEAVEKSFREYHPELSVPSWAIRFAASRENVGVVLSGMSSIGQMEDNLSYMENFQPLNEEEEERIRQAVEIINESIEIQCTGCSYCTHGCPKQIPIPKYFSLYNTDKKDIAAGWTPQQEYYERLTTHETPASQCIGCGQCERICPQHLPIIEDLKKVAEHFEKTEEE